MSHSFSMKDRPFNPHRICRSSSAQHITKLAIQEITQHERRKRARTSKAQMVFELQVEALIADVCHHHLTDGDGWVSVTRSKRILGRVDRYRHPVMKESLSKVIDQLVEMDFIDYCPGGINPFDQKLNRQSTIRASASLRELINAAQLDADDFGCRNDGEVIILKQRRENHFDRPVRLPYKDTPDTYRYRSQVKAINAWLAAAEIDFDPCYKDELVDIHDRSLQRVFNAGSFCLGGRLFGGFWQPLSKTERADGLLINGKPVTTLDFGQIAPRIMYGLVGEQVHFDDAYDIPGLDPSFRQGIKKIFSAMLFSDKPLRQFPRGTRKLIPKTSIKIDQIVSAIEQFHRPIVRLFHADVGLKVMFLESEVLIEVMERLMEKGIVGLPIHDALIVERDQASTVKEIMQSVFKERIGTTITVSHDDR